MTSTLLRRLVRVRWNRVHTAISEFIPARHRGKTNATVMNFRSLGAILAALVSLYPLTRLPPDLGWRVAFGFGALVAVFTALARRFIPESPRWLRARAGVEAAAAVVADIETARWSAARVGGASAARGGAARGAGLYD